MLATCVVLCALTVRAGDVVLLPPGAAPIAAGGVNWALREGKIAVPPRTKAIVVRTAPDGLVGVAEVRLYDGTDRLAWVEDGALVAIRPPTPVVGAVAPARSSAPSRASAVAVASRAGSTGPRRKRRPDFSQVDAAIAAMWRAALAADAATPRGMGVYTMPVFNMPVFQMPVFNMAVF